MSATTGSIQGLIQESARGGANRARADGRDRIIQLSAALRDHRHPLALGIVVLSVLLIGRASSLERYITPEYGIGYALGIAGGSMMLALLIYPLRKRFRSLHWLGPVKYWFRTHMVFGVLGPSLILFHCNFSLGATNSNVALFAMLTVALSGIVGRYFYARIHHGLYGAKVELRELRQDAELARRGLDRFFEDLPALADMLERFEQSALNLPRSLLASALRLPPMAVRAHLLHRAAMRAVRDHLGRQGMERRARAALRREISSYLNVYIDGVRKVAETAFYERLFASWHVLHLPLFVMLLFTATFHVIAVHVY